MQKPTQFVFGVLITILWVVLGIALACSSYVTRPTALDAWANVLAGFFSPIAFLWLVLGYRQQGQELQQNSRALLLQAEELKLAVEQYKDMAQTQREQLAHEKALHAREEDERANARKPDFDILAVSIGSSSDQPVQKFTVVNRGATVADVKFNPQDFEIMVDRPMIPRFESEKSLEIKFKMPSLRNFILEIHYVKSDGAGFQRIQVYEQGAAGDVQYRPKTITAAT